MPGDSSLKVLSELEALLLSEGYTDDRKALVLVRSIRRDLGSVSSSPSEAPPPQQDYTASRARALHATSLTLKKVLAEAKAKKVSYPDRARTLLVVADNYLKLTHAFKVDNTVWACAQNELVPALTSVSDEKSIDAAVLLLEKHIDSYLTSLSSWLSRSG